MKMLIVCKCGTKLRVAMAQYLKMRCPKCQLMLAEEIERQAARNSKTVLDMAAILLHERMTAKRWTIVDEKMSRLLAQHEIESHGGVWPPVQKAKEDVFVLSTEEPIDPSPLQPQHVHTAPPPPPPAPEEKKKKKSIKVKIKKNGRR